MSKTQPVPKGFHTVTPHLVVRNAAGALDYYRRAFGAEILEKLAAPGGGPIMHATVRIGDSLVMLNDEMEGQKGPEGSSPVTIHLYVPNADATYRNAVDAGGQSIMPVSDMPWGDRYGILADPYGHSWAVATRVEEVSEEELYRRLAAAPQ
jgi:uncharacterized glyoxalase superfamily protein PhnB